MKKKILSLLLSLAMLLMLLPSLALAAAPPIELTVTADKASVKVGDTVTFNVTLTTDGTKPLGGVSATFSIPAGLTYNSNSGTVADGLKAATGAEDASFTETSKRFILSAANGLQLSTSTALMTFTCTATAAGSFSVGVTDVELSDISFDVYTNGTDYAVTPASVSVTKELSSLTVKTAPTKTSYVVGQSFDPAGTVLTATYSDSTEDIAAADFASKGVTYAPTAALTDTNNKVTFSYGGKSVDQTITVATKTVSSIAITTQSSRLTFKQDEDFIYPNLAVTATYNDGTTGVLDASAYTVTGSTATVGDGQTATVTLKANSAVTATYTFNVTAKALTSIDITTAPNKTSYTLGEPFSGEGMVVKAYYDNSKNTTLASGAYTITGNDVSSVGSKTVTVSYTEGGVTKTDTFTITVSAAKLATPTATLTQGTSDGLTVTWAEVSHASSYTVKIYQGSTLKKTVTSATSPLNIPTDGTDIQRGVSYTATVTAIGDGTNYSSSDESAKSSAVAAKGKTLTVAAMELSDNAKDYSAGSAQTPTVNWTGTSYTATNAGSITIGLTTNYAASETNAGTYDVYVKSNGGTVYEALDWAKIGIFTINKIDYAGTKKAAASAKYGATGTCNLASILPAGYSLGTVTTTDTDSVISGAPTVSGTTLSFTFANAAANAGKTATITIPVTSSTNYNAFDITVTVTVTAKPAQANFKFASATQTKIYGDADFIVAATGAVTGSSVTYISGDTSIATVDNTGKVHIVKAGGPVIITATAAATTDYAEGNATYNLTVNKATITITANHKTVYVNATTPTLTSASDYTVTGLVGAEKLKTLPTLKYVGTPDMTKTGTYAIVPSGAEAPDGGNYNEIKYRNGTLTITTPSSATAPGTFNVTFNTNGGSAVGTVSGKSGEKLDLASYKPTKEGYTFAGWYTDAALTQPVSSVTLSANITLYAKWTAAQEKGNPFTDVKTTDFFHDAVLWAAGKNVTDGTTPTTFSPADRCTRGQVVTFLWRAMGSPAPKGTGSFSDVSSGKYYANAIQWAVEQDITKGTSDTAFSPNNTVTRAQFVTFLWRLAGSPAPKGTSPFSDATDPASPYYQAILWAYEQGITTGDTATTFGGSLPCTRGQVVTFLYRYFGK